LKIIFCSQCETSEGIPEVQALGAFFKLHQTEALKIKSPYEEMSIKDTLDFVNGSGTNVSSAS
jgi:hypothetical protein